MHDESFDSEYPKSVTIIDLRSVKNILTTDFVKPQVINLSQTSALEICQKIGPNTLLVSDASPICPGNGLYEARFFEVTNAKQTHFEDVYPLNINQALLSTVHTSGLPSIALKILSIPNFKKTKSRAYAISSVAFYEGLDAIAVHRSWRPYFEPVGETQSFKIIYFY